MHQEAQPHTVRILHLEDSVLDHDIVKRTLRKAHLLFEIERVEMLPEFEQAVQSSRFDVVLADYRLPGFTALDAWDALQTLARQPPFILLSGAIGETAALQTYAQVQRLSLFNFLS